MRVLALVIGAIAIAAISLGNTTGYSSTASYLPSITLIDQNSGAVSLASLRGKPVLVGFIHTMCKGPCEMMTAKMRSVASVLPPPSASDVTMLLITTDPSDDHPQQLRQYAKDQDLPSKGWILATGSHHNIRQVMRIYGVSHEDTDDSMMHVMKLFLIAPDGSVSHIYPGMKASPQAVALDIKALSHQNSAASEGSASLR
jgi:cytochrome oxidase Cu insertion factor (SCO1/SenC/PrrC family)